MTKKYNAIIFDLDGTLCDLSLAMADAYNQVFQRFNINKTVTYSFARYICSLPYKDYHAALLDGIPTSLHTQLIPYLTEYANDSVKSFSNAALYDGIAEGLPKLAKKYPLFIVSNCGINYLNLFLETSSIGNLFTDTLCHGHNFKSKAENISLMIHRHNLTCPCYIGDSPSDELSAHNAKLDFFFAAYGACYQESLSQSPNFKDFQAILDHFLTEEV